MHALRMRNKLCSSRMKYGSMEAPMEVWKRRWKYGSASVREGWDGPLRPSILPSALPYFHRRFSTNLALLFACAKCKRTTGEASTNTHEVKSWMASNRQGPIVAAATRDGLIRHYFFEGFGYRLIACFLYFVHGINISPN